VIPPSPIGVWSSDSMRHIHTHAHAHVLRTSVTILRIICFTELSNSASARKVAAELNKVRHMYDNVCVLVEKDGAKKGDLSRYVHHSIYLL